MANGRLKDPSLRWMVVLWMFEEGKDVLQKGSRNLEPANKYELFFFNKESYTHFSFKVRFVECHVSFSSICGMFHSCFPNTIAKPEYTLDLTKYDTRMYCFFGLDGFMLLLYDTENQVYYPKATKLCLNYLGTS